MKIRTELNRKTAPKWYTSPAYAFVNGKYDMWLNGGNCTHYAYARSCEIANKDVRQDLMEFFPNACYWYESANWKKGNTPKPGAIACYGRTTTAGHVEIVEEVYPDGSYLVSESGWNSFLFKTRRRNLSVGDKLDNVAGVLMGFIYNPYVEETTPETAEIGSDEAIERMAHDVIEGKYGNGKTTRMLRLYQVVQRKVNEILGG